MNLVIDRGNTRTKWAVFDGRELLEKNSDAELAIEQLNKIFETYAIRHHLFASVAGDDGTMESYLEGRAGYIQLTPKIPLPIQNAYKTPETLGKDRIAVAVGAAALFPKKNVLVIDAGTCITLDFVDASGAYLGGSITPGLHLRFKALNSYTGRLPLLELRDIDFVTGRNTEESILSGVQYGILAEVDGMINAYLEKYPGLIVVITGGDAAFFESRLKNEIFAVPDLVLQGLNEIILYNASMH